MSFDKVLCLPKPYLFFCKTGKGNFTSLNRIEKNHLDTKTPAYSKSLVNEGSEYFNGND